MRVLAESNSKNDFDKNAFIPFGAAKIYENRKVIYWSLINQY